MNIMKNYQFESQNLCQQIQLENIKILFCQIQLLFTLLERFMYYNYYCERFFTINIIFFKIKHKFDLKKYPYDI